MAEDRKEFKNQSGGWIGVVKFNAERKPEGVSVAPGGTVVLTAAEAQLTAEAHIDPKDNPFLERKRQVWREEGDEFYFVTEPAPLVEVSDVEDGKLSTRPVPAFGIDGPDPYEDDAAEQRRLNEASEADAERQRAQAEQDAAAREDADAAAARERQEQEAAAAAREREEQEAARAASAANAARVAAAQPPAPASPPAPAATPATPPPAADNA